MSVLYSLINKCQIYINFAYLIFPILLCMAFNKIQLV